ncbi:MAG: hypothetical protein ACK55Z_01080, partial [bacterium]
CPQSKALEPAPLLPAAGWSHLVDRPACPEREAAQCLRQWSHGPGTRSPRRRQPPRCPPPQAAKLGELGSDPLPGCAPTGSCGA